MRFGIMSMQRGSLIPAGLSTEETLAYVAALDHARLARGLYEQGFNPIELGGDVALFLPHTLDAPTLARLLDLKRATDVAFTVHLPLWSVEPSTPLAPVREGSVRALVDCIQATLCLEPEVYVMHATGALAAEFYRMRLSELARGFLLRQFQQHARQSIREVLDATGINSRRLAIETVEFPFELTLELAETLDLSLCLDTGHVLVGFSGPLNVDEALESCLPRLVEVHLHDGRWQGPERTIGYGQDHRPLGRGDLDVGRLLDRLHGAGFGGPIILELSVEEAIASLEAIQDLRPDYLKVRT